MPTSEARIAANRLNSARSTGPRTDAGKAASRANALKHGLTGAGVVMTDEQATDAGRLADELTLEMRPTTKLGQILVQRLAAHAVRAKMASKQWGKL